ncbi:MAG: hypothetical protein OMM_00552 [Candidatus Magnetoglobus multicellularis str. Araruama]|uniref:Baseplate protein J-like domain-containing protein n=1 Tax=Candidatus Magnetoglobus multicellularis str. Araruama TaxID=890399 RepID=A0A1V1PGV0_9BACT|nr:MAG: hypothetical protein OMM_00552 [Candidatus Magnetoglobus multicellularis str. Araruama]
MLTAQGYEYTRLSTIINRINQAFINIFGENINIDPDQPLGQIIAIFADELSGIHDIMSELYHSFVLSAARGVHLDNLVAFNGITRKPGETDEQLRTRNEKSIFAYGQYYSESLKGQLLNLDNVTKAVVYDNKTDKIDSYGIPPHQFSVIVEGGQEDDIARVILLNNTIGIMSYGNILKTINDSEGVPQKVYFSRPVHKNIYIKVVVDIDSSIYKGDEDFKTSIETYCKKEFDVGCMVKLNKIYCCVNAISGVEDIEDIFIDISLNPDKNENIVMAYNEIGFYSIEQIEVLHV